MMPSDGEPTAGGVLEGTAAAGDEHVARDLFPCPLPLDDLKPVDPSRLCRATTRRLQRSLHWKRWRNDGVDALNQMYGAGAAPCELPLQRQASECQRACLSRLVEIYREAGSPPSDVESL